MGKIASIFLMAVAFMAMMAVSFAGGSPEKVSCIATIPSSFESGKENGVFLELEFFGVDTADLSKCEVTVTLQFGQDSGLSDKKNLGMRAKYHRGVFLVDIFASKRREGYYAIATDIRVETPEGRVYEIPGKVYTNKADAL